VSGLADKLGAGKVTPARCGVGNTLLCRNVPDASSGVHERLIPDLSPPSALTSVCNQASSHQNLVYSLEPQARGRLNALLFTVVFIGMALGSALGSNIYSAFAGWSGVVALATVCGAIALAIRFIENAR
jgi:MFS family permease